ncbi:MAG TPA: hypothetical protein PLX83_16975 [bacterium]|nr:hypothetical protein [bacterium]
MKLKEKILFQLFKELPYIEVEILCRMYGLCGARQEEIRSISKDIGLTPRVIKRRASNAIKYIRALIQHDPQLQEGVQMLCEILNDANLSDTEFSEISYDFAALKWLKAQKTLKWLKAQKKNIIRQEKADINHD